jgi:hypothetical protein
MGWDDPCISWTWMHASMCARPVIAFEVPIGRRASFSPTGDRSARESVADPGLRRHGRRLEKRQLVEGLRVVSGGLSLRCVRLTRRGVRAHVKTPCKAELVVGAWKWRECGWRRRRRAGRTWRAPRPRGGILAFGTGVERRDPTDGWNKASPSASIRLD